MGSGKADVSFVEQPDDVLPSLRSGCNDKSCVDFVTPICPAILTPRDAASVFDEHHSGCMIPADRAGEHGGVAAPGCYARILIGSAARAIEHSVGLCEDIHDVLSALRIREQPCHGDLWLGLGWQRRGHEAFAIDPCAAAPPRVT